ncbi:hypothetical protein [Cellulosilyticum ruminicola]|uniref:hypothetical protein n=1 Tax=Cellulosilyticum ruminicola TaxID=425254 RepID=UPI0006D0D376|nr:hypothetical protein [Cellulosilyticum ruminicola]
MNRIIPVYKHKDMTIFIGTIVAIIAIYSVVGTIRLKNCSNKAVGPFKVAITLKPTKLHPAGSFICRESFELGPKEESSLVVNYEGLLEGFSDEGLDKAQMYLADKDFQITLLGENEQVTFYAE